MNSINSMEENLDVQYTAAYCRPCLEKKIGFPVAKLYAEIAARSAARRGEMVVGERVSLKEVIWHGVTIGNGPGFFKL